jgi:uncharacterized protein YkwD
MFSALLKLTAMALMGLESTTTATPAKVDLHPVEQAIIDGTNAERARYGLAPLALDPALERTARYHAAWMTNSHNLQHSSIGVAENIAWGQHSAQEAMSSWMSSSGHRANILNASYRRIGVSAYTAPDGSCFWCQQFMQ